MALPAPRGRTQTRWAGTKRDAWGGPGLTTCVVGPGSFSRRGWSRAGVVVVLVGALVWWLSERAHPDR